MDKLLITTSIVDTWVLNENFNRIFLSEACKLYSLKHIWYNFKHEVPQYHWNDRVKLKSDHTYVSEFYEKILKEVAIKLNTIHDVNNSVEYWRILLGPWLINYISIIFDRMEQLKAVYNKYDQITTVDLSLNDNNFKAPDFEGFLKMMQTDEWNYLIYKRIIKDIYINTKFLKVDFKQNAYKLNTLVSSKKNFKRGIFKIISEFFDLLSPKNNKFLFHTSYFSFWNLISLNFSLGQFPRFDISTFSFECDSVINEEYRSYEIGFLGENNFEYIINKYLFSDMPMAYLENFKKIQTFTQSISLDPSIILSANSYWSNDVFKAWLAQMRLKGKKILILEHGGSFPLPYMTFLHEEKIADKFITWFIPHLTLHYKQLQLPPSKIDKVGKPDFEGVYCSFLGFESPRYGYRIGAQPMNIQVLESFDNSIIFYNKLMPQIKEQFLIRPYPNLGWETKLRYSSILGDEKVKASPEQSFKQFFKNARIIVCSYPQTTFSEAMASGKPCILVYNPDHNESVLEANELIIKLLRASIIFHDPILAAEHVNKYWNSLDEWWNSESVVEARSLFLKTAIKMDTDFKNEWVTFLKNYLYV